VRADKLDFDFAYICGQQPRPVTILSPPTFLWDWKFFSLQFLDWTRTLASSFPCHFQVRPSSFMSFFPSPLVSLTIFSWCFVLRLFPTCVGILLRSDQSIRKQRRFKSPNYDLFTCIGGCPDGFKWSFFFWFSSVLGCLFSSSRSAYSSIFPLFYETFWPYVLFPVQLSSDK